MNSAPETPAPGEEPGSAAEEIRIVLADDHAVVRSALRMLLDAEPGMEVVAEAGDVDEALRYLRGHKPEILILDLNMPGRASLEALPEIMESSPDTRVVVLTMQSEVAFAREAVQAGVLGYILKEAADTELVKAIRLAAQGRTYLQPDLGARMAVEPQGSSDGLSAREMQVLRLLALGHRNQDIAAELGLGIRTVESHRSMIQRKLKFSKRTELVRYALERGMLDADANERPRDSR